MALCHVDQLTFAHSFFERPQLSSSEKHAALQGGHVGPSTFLPSFTVTLIIVRVTANLVIAGQLIVHLVFHVSATPQPDPRWRTNSFDLPLPCLEEASQLINLCARFLFPPALAVHLFFFTLDAASVTACLVTRHRVLGATWPARCHSLIVVGLSCFALTSSPLLRFLCHCSLRSPHSTSCLTVSNERLLTKPDQAA